MFSIIKNWFGLQNIVCNDFYKTFLVSAENDLCNEYKINECNQNGCVEYEKSDASSLCVNKDRIKKFIKPNEFINKLTEKAYIIIESKRYEYTSFGINKIIDITDNENISPRENGGNFTISYKIFKSKDEPIYYVLFSPGIKDISLYFSDINILLNQIIDYLIQLVVDKNDVKIILGGHSMGCTIALQLGFLLFKKNKNFFLRYCILIGSAPSNFINYDSEENKYYKNLPNIFIFYFGVVYQGKKYIDCFYFNGNKNFSIYYPSFFLLSKITTNVERYINSNKNPNTSDTTKLYKQINTSEYGINNKYFYKFNEFELIDTSTFIYFCALLHSWSSYAVLSINNTFIEEIVTIFMNINNNYIQVSQNPNIVVAQDVALGNSQPPPENLDTMEEAYGKVSLEKVLLSTYRPEQNVPLKRLKDLLLDTVNKTFDDSTRDLPKEQKKWYIPDEQFNNLIFRIEEAFPELKYNKAATPESQPKAVAWRAATDRQQKERSYFKHGRVLLVLGFQRKQKVSVENQEELKKESI